MRRFQIARHLPAFLVVGLLNAASPVPSPDVNATQLRPSREYERIDIETLGGANNFGFAIDDKGRVLGVGQKATGEFTYFLWKAGSLAELGIIPYEPASPERSDMNGRGLAVGTANVGNRRFAFLYQDGISQELGFEYAVGINKHGVVLGFNTHPTLSVQPFLWKDGVTTNLADAGGTFFPRALNDRGDVVGEGSSPNHGVLWRDGVIYDLGVLDGCEHATAEDINNHRQVVGFCIGDSTERGFLWENGVLTDLGMAGFPFSEASAINEQGQIVGTYYSFTESGGYLWHEGIMTDLGLDVFPVAIDDDGRIVGLRSGHAFVWDNGVMTDLGPGRANDINERGEIVGHVKNPGSPSHPAVWVPVRQDRVAG